MPDLRAFLARFRPAGSPGPAGGGAVPADRTAELTAELAPVLALLDGTLAEAAAIRESAADEAAGRRRAAAERAEREVRTARERALEVRRETARRLRHAYADENGRTADDARRAVQELRARARERTGDLAARLVSRAVTELAAVPGVPAGGTSWEAPWARGGSPE